MADTSIQFDRSLQLSQEIKAYINACRKVVTDGPNLLAAIVHIVDNDGSSETDYAKFKTLTGCTDNAMAQSLYNELASVNAKCTSDASQTNVAAALKQVADKTGVI